jgi:ubiquinone/menaquinone biosynthesis C-methylase UbiE
VNQNDAQEFTPAAGQDELSDQYDRLVRIFARERAWRPLLAERIAPRPGQLIVDIGCGTGTLAILLKQRCPEAKIVGVDPDVKILAIAQAKAKVADVDVQWHQGFADSAPVQPGSADVAVSSLVLHQVSIVQKHAIIGTMLGLVNATGLIHIADYGRQSGLMRWLFRQTVQKGDGVANTQPNADGMIEGIFAGLGLVVPLDDRRISTPSGTISIFSRRKPNER